MTFGGRRSAITTMIYLKFDDNVFVVLNKLLWSQFVRLHLLLTMKDSAMDVPTNLDARRRITFFANSLFMKMPRAPRVHDMISFRCVYISSMSFYFSSIVRPNFSGFCKKYFFFRNENIGISVFCCEVLVDCPPLPKSLSFWVHLVGA